MVSTGFKKRPTKQQDIDAFVGGAEQSAISSHSAAPTEDYPWLASGIRADVLRTYNLRLPEPYLLKLKYIASQSPRSMQRFSLDTLLPAIDAEIARLTARQRME